MRPQFSFTHTVIIVLTLVCFVATLVSSGRRPL